MIYLNGFCMPNQFIMDEYEWTGAYPFGILYFMELNYVKFDRITVFYGGNGSGKSTLLKLIAQKCGLEHRTVVDNTDDFINFLNMCSCSYYEDDIVSYKKPPLGSEVITSEDIMHKILELRENNSIVSDRRQKTRNEYMESRYSPNTLTSLENFEDFKRRNKSKRLSAAKFVNELGGIREREFSNGENVLIYFEEILKTGKLYLLDEPETSLSPEFQFKVAEKITEMARYGDCQFIIATHSPFILGIEGARIYNLDSRPVEVCQWEELKNIRFYYKYFMERREKFEGNFG
ncbi:MAG TPA: AAA family ATPase [Clostridiales bacterium]|nr:AAA family ATPase [Clostridiales bacterium]